MTLFDVSAFLAWLLPTIAVLGWVSVFIGVLIEEIIIPIPSPLVLMAAGFVLIPASASIDQALGIAFFTIAIPGAVAMTLGSLFVYAIGHYGGDAVINKFGRFLDTSVADVEKMGQKIQKSKRVWLTVFLLRIIFVVPTSIVSLASGLLHLDWKKFALSTFIGAIPRIFALSLIGWKVGDAFIAFAESFGSIENAVLALIVVAIAAFYYLKIHRKKKK